MILINPTFKSNICKIIYLIIKYFELIEVFLYLSLFLSSFLAATLLPAQSEAVLVLQLASNKNELWYLILIATLGNVSGALVNWYLGKFFTQYKEKKWFPITIISVEAREGGETKRGAPLET